MKMLMTAVLLQISILGFASDICSQKNTPQIEWHPYLTFTTVSDFGEVDAQLCFGVNHDSGTVHGIYYIPVEGEHEFMSVKELMKSKNMLSATDLPYALQIVIRSSPLLAIKILNINQMGQKQEYQIQLTFLRNLGKGITRNDYRKVVFKSNLDLDHHSVLSQIKQKNKNILFDHFDLVLDSIPLSVENISLEYLAKPSLTLDARELTKTNLN
jgi:hypothetical protein